MDDFRKRDTNVNKEMLLELCEVLFMRSANFLTTHFFYIPTSQSMSKFNIYITGNPCHLLYVIFFFITNQDINSIILGYMVQNSGLQPT